jgi:hypothetical protein
MPDHFQNTAIFMSEKGSILELLVLKVTVNRHHLQLFLGVLTSYWNEMESSTLTDR